ncbi:MAG: hypothetical protein QM726_13350 [Chitinophagaceae bacterium]
MLINLPANAYHYTGEINNFLKNEAEIVADFKTRIVLLAKENEFLKAVTGASFHRITNTMNDAECSAFLSDTSYFMEENY